MPGPIAFEHIELPAIISPFPFAHGTSADRQRAHIVRHAKRHIIPIQRTGAAMIDMRIGRLDQPAVTRCRLEFSKQGCGTVNC